MHPTILLTRAKAGADFIQYLRPKIAQHHFMLRCDSPPNITRDPAELRTLLRIQLMAFGIGFAAAGALLVLITA